MNTIQINYKDTLVNNQISFGVPIIFKDVRNKTVLISGAVVNATRSVFKKSVFGAFWTVLSSPLS